MQNILQITIFHTVWNSAESTWQRRKPSDMRKSRTVVLSWSGHASIPPVAEERKSHRPRQRARESIEQKTRISYGVESESLTSSHVLWSAVLVDISVLSRSKKMACKSNTTCPSIWRDPFSANALTYWRDRQSTIAEWKISRKLRRRGRASNPHSKFDRGSLGVPTKKLLYRCSRC